MKHKLKIDFRTTLISMFAVVFFATSSLAGVVPVDRNCGAPCCQPGHPDGVGLAKANLSSNQPKSCCAGMASSHCDLQGQPVAQHSHFFQAVPSSPSDSLIRMPTSHHRRRISGFTDIGGPPARRAAPESTPVYIEIQSILI